MKIINCSGQYFQGKDTLCDYLRVKLNERLGYNYWQRTAFAKGVKTIFCNTFNKDMYFVEKWKTVDTCPPGLDMTVRKALQFIGDGFRKIQSSIWIDLVFRDPSPKIISDGRYISELRAVKAQNGLVITIARPDRINNDPNSSEAEIRPLVEWAIKNKDKEHLAVKEWISSVESPPEAKLIDYIIVNDASIPELYAKIDKILVPAVENYFKE